MDYLTNSTVKSNLDIYGYHKFTNFYDNTVFKENVCCKDGTVNYKRLQPHIYNCLEQLKNIGWDPIMAKYRFSPGCENLESSNSTDAGALHRDLIVYNDDLPQVYTLIYYTDPSILKVVDGSHKEPARSLMKSIFSKTTYIEFEPNDALLFNACLLHGGYFIDNTIPRGILQCFDIFPNEKLAQQYGPKLGHVVGGSIDTGLQISKYSTSMIAGIGNYISYLINSMGYGKGEIDLPDGITYLSGEAFRSRLPENFTEERYDKGNVYIRTKEPYTKDIENYEYIRDHLYYYNYWYTFVYMMIILIVVFIVCFKLI